MKLRFVTREGRLLNQAELLKLNEFMRRALNTLITRRPKATSMPVDK